MFLHVIVFCREPMCLGCGMIFWKKRKQKFLEGEDGEIKLKKCAFCGERFEKTDELLKAGSNVYICNSCLNRIAFNLANRLPGAGKPVGSKEKELASCGLDSGFMKRGAAAPCEIRRHLDRFIIGQERAKKVLSVAVCNHIKRLQDRKGLIRKSNILLAGPSGCGKTLLAETLAKILNVPFAEADATSMTKAGYIGDDVWICLHRLLEAADGDVKLAEKGVVFIDEIDKIACRGGGGVADVSSGGVQSGLLKLLEGREVSFPVSGNGKRRHSKNVTMDTSSILFICGGAFQELTDTGADMCHPIGFLAGGYQDRGTADSPVNAESLVKYGMMPEFVGRLPVICRLDGLTESDLVRILTEPEDAITKEYEALLKKDGVKLVFEPEALSEIAKIAAARKTGARGLRGILEDMMLDVMYDLPGRTDISKCIITSDTVRSGKPDLVKKTG